MSSLSTLETKSFLIGFKTELPSTTAEPWAACLRRHGGILINLACRPAPALGPWRRSCGCHPPLVPSLPHLRDSRESRRSREPV